MASNAAEVPASYSKNLCACIGCHLVKTKDQFYNAGCENCAFLDIEGSRDRVDDCTTVEFSGVVSVLRPGASWCAKWLRVEHAVPGCYAISVRPPVERLPDDVIEKLERRGIDWRGGDGGR